MKPYIIWDTILQMTFILIKPLLWKPSPCYKEKKRKLFAKCQESTRKNVEKAFGVLKYRFAIICGPSRSWHIDTMNNIILTCIILHNMIVEDEQNTYNDNVDVDYDHIDEEILKICYIPTNKTLYAYNISSSITSNRLVKHV